jgi:hypothetical protein
MKVHFEPYVYLAGLTHKSALVAWGGFSFKVARLEGGLLVKISGRRATVTPIGEHGRPLAVLAPDGSAALATTTIDL